MILFYRKEAKVKPRFFYRPLKCILVTLLSFQFQRPGNLDPIVNTKKIPLPQSPHFSTGSQSPASPCEELVLNVFV